jgi:hypothetical protein
MVMIRGLPTTQRALKLTVYLPLDWVAVSVSTRLTL